MARDPFDEAWYLQFLQGIFLLYALPADVRQDILLMMPGMCNSYKGI